MFQKFIRKDSLFETKKNSIYNLEKSCDRFSIRFEKRWQGDSLKEKKPQCTPKSALCMLISIMESQQKRCPISSKKNPREQERALNFNFWRKRTRFFFYPIV